MLRYIHLISFLFLICLFSSFEKKDSVLFEQRLGSIDNNYRSDLDFYKRELSLELKEAKKINSSFFEAKCYHILGKIHVQKAQYDSAQTYFYKSLSIRLDRGYMAHAATTYESLSDIDFRLGEDSTALDNLYKSLAIKEGIGNEEYLMSLYNSLGTAHYNLDDLDSAEFYYLKGFGIAETLQDTQVIAASYSSLGDVRYMKDFETEALQMYGESVRLYQAQNRFKESAVPLYNMGSVHDWLGNGDSALYYFQLAMIQAKKGGNNEYIGAIAQSLAETFVSLDQPDSAIAMFQNYITYRDSVFDEEKVSAILAAETKYQTKEAEQQAAFQKAEKEKFQAQDENKRLTIYSLLGAFGLAGAVAFFWWRNTRQKVKLTELEVDIKNQEIDNLLKEQEAKSYAALLEGQNAERERIAQDLHDRLGGTLSAVKVHFGVMDQKIEDMKSENRVLFDKVNGMLNDAVQDVRRISHDLVSGRIAKLGLRGALEDLSNVLSKAKKMDVDFYMDQALPDFEQKKEQEIYAIIQELVSNMLKHAQATTVDIQLNKQDEIMNIMFEDNGTGFSMEKELGKGLGIAGISKRVEELEGTVNYDSVIGRGTIVIINIPL